MADDVILAFACAHECEGIRDYSAGREVSFVYACIVEAWVSISEPKVKFNQIGITAVRRDKLRDKTMRDRAKTHVSLPVVGGKGLG